MTRLTVTDVRLMAALTPDVIAGLLGYASLTICGSLRLDGIALRRTQTGRLALSYPERRDSEGHQHPYVWPLDDAARQAIEAAIFDALREQGVLP